MHCVISPSLGLLSTTAGLINEVGVSEKDDNITSVSGVYELLCITMLRGRRNHGHDVTLCVAIHSLKSHVMFRDVDRIVAGNIETMSLEIRI